MPHNDDSGGDHFPLRHRENIRLHQRRSSYASYLLIILCISSITAAVVHYTFLLISCGLMNPYLVLTIMATTEKFFILVCQFRSFFLVRHRRVRSLKLVLVYTQFIFIFHFFVVLLESIYNVCLFIYEFQLENHKVIAITALIQFIISVFYLVGLVCVNCFVYVTHLVNCEVALESPVYLDTIGQLSVAKMAKAEADRRARATVAETPRQEGGGHYNEGNDIEMEEIAPPAIEARVQAEDVHIVRIQALKPQDAKNSMPPVE